MNKEIRKYYKSAVLALIIGLAVWAIRMLLQIYLGQLVNEKKLSFNINDSFLLCIPRIPDIEIR